MATSGAERVEQRTKVPTYTGSVGLARYVIAHLGRSVWASLRPWYTALSARDDLQLIQRNIDRECNRSDIDQRVWLDFLLDVSAAPASPDSCQTIDTVLQGKLSYYALAGKPLAKLTDPTFVYRFMRLDHFLKYMLPALPIVSIGYGTLAEQVNNGVVTGANLDSKPFGRTGYPIWCTLSGSPNWRTSADRSRDRFGLKHIDSGHLVEMRYPIGLLSSVFVPLKAPTVLDSWAAGASNWIFAKKRGSGGPEWGYTVDLDGGGACGRGSTEAVHASFTVPAGQGWTIDLRAHGPIAASAPAVSYRALLVNPTI